MGPLRLLLVTVVTQGLFASQINCNGVRGRSRPVPCVMLSLESTLITIIEEDVTMLENVRFGI